MSYRHSEYDIAPFEAKERSSEARAPLEASPYNTVESKTEGGPAARELVKIARKQRSVALSQVIDITTSRRTDRQQLRIWRLPREIAWQAQTARQSTG